MQFAPVGIEYVLLEQIAQAAILGLSVLGLKPDKDALPPLGMRKDKPPIRKM
ncbi:hypothetical protein TM233_37540 [Bradyrhizobium sp. TM233]|nr:hypothetical protein TM233_37540 [Bradyrhizobium sp. TM233]